jgi:signal transduction histidine kinase
MENTKALFGYDNLAFYGKVSASISHELKNIMAIISETSGLLNDLGEMAVKGTPIDPKMLKGCTVSIAEEIQRGFDTIRQMNRFAHSVDTPVASINLVELLDLVCNLFGFLAFAGKIQIQPCEAPKPIAATVPFLLQELVYQVLIQTFKSSGPGAEIEIAVKAHNDSTWRIHFYGFRSEKDAMFPNDAIEKIASTIGVQIHWDQAASRLALEVPLSIESVLADQVSSEMLGRDNGPQPLA